MENQSHGKHICFVNRKSKYDASVERNFERNHLFEKMPQPQPSHAPEPPERLQNMEGQKIENEKWIMREVLMWCDKNSKMQSKKDMCERTRTHKYIETGKCANASKTI